MLAQNEYAYTRTVFGRHEYIYILLQRRRLRIISFTIAYGNANWRRRTIFIHRFQTPFHEVGIYSLPAVTNERFRGYSLRVRRRRAVAHNRLTRHSERRLSLPTTDCFCYYRRRPRTSTTTPGMDSSIVRVDFVSFSSSIFQLTERARSKLDVSTATVYTKDSNIVQRAVSTVRRRRFFIDPAKSFDSCLFNLRVLIKASIGSLHKQNVRNDFKAFIKGVLRLLFIFDRTNLTVFRSS